MIAAALIGLGDIAWKYDARRPGNGFALSQAGALSRRGGVILRGGCSPSRADREAFSAAYPGRAVFADAGRMLSELKPDLVGICSPVPEHYRQARLCLEAGVRAVWLEKPPTETLPELDDLAAMAEDKQAKVAVNYPRRYLPAYRRLRERFQAGHFGSCRVIRVLYSPGLDRNGVHMLDLLFFVTGAEDCDLLWVEAGECASPCFALRLSTGHLVEAAGADVPYHTNDISLVCDGGIFSLVRGGKLARVEKLVGNDLFPGFYDLEDSGDGSLLGPGGLDGYMENGLADLIGCLEKGGQPISNLHTARPTQKLVDDVKRGGRP